MTFLFMLYKFIKRLLYKKEDEPYQFQYPPPGFASYGQELQELHYREHRAKVDEAKVLIRAELAKIQRQREEHIMRSDTAEEQLRQIHEQTNEFIKSNLIKQFNELHRNDFAQSKVAQPPTKPLNLRKGLVTRTRH